MTRVALEPGITCGKCEFCKSGHYNLCPDVVFLATPPVQGCNEEFIAFPEDMCFKLPENVSTKEGALIEPLSVGFYAAEQGNVGTGDTVVILGSGCIGLVTLLACKAQGAGPDYCSRPCTGPSGQSYGTWCNSCYQQWGRRCS